MLKGKRVEICLQFRSLIFLCYGEAVHSHLLSVLIAEDLEDPSWIPPSYCYYLSSLAYRSTERDSSPYGYSLLDYFVSPCVACHGTFGYRVQKKPWWFSLFKSYVSQQTSAIQISSQKKPQVSSFQAPKSVRYSFFSAIDSRVKILSLKSHLQSFSCVPHIPLLAPKPSSLGPYPSCKKSQGVTATKTLAFKTTGICQEPLKQFWQASR